MWGPGRNNVAPGFSLRARPNRRSFILSGLSPDAQGLNTEWLDAEVIAFDQFVVLEVVD